MFGIRFSRLSETDVRNVSQTRTSLFQSQASDVSQTQTSGLSQTQISGLSQTLTSGLTQTHISGLTQSQTKDVSKTQPRAKRATRRGRQSMHGMSTRSTRRSQDDDERSSLDLLDDIDSDERTTTSTAAEAAHWQATSYVTQRTNVSVAASPSTSAVSASELHTAAATNTSREQVSALTTLCTYIVFFHTAVYRTLTRSLRRTVSVVTAAPTAGAWAARHVASSFMYSCAYIATNCYRAAASLVCAVTSVCRRLISSPVVFVRAAVTSSYDVICRTATWTAGALTWIASSMASAARSVTECMARAVAHVLRLLLLVVTYLLLVVVVLFKTLVRLPVTLYQGCASVLRGSRQRTSRDSVDTAPMTSGVATRSSARLAKRLSFTEANDPAINGSIGLTTA